MKRIIIIITFILTNNNFANCLLFQDSTSIESNTMDTIMTDESPTMIYTVGLGFQGLGIVNLKETFQGRNLTGYISSEFLIWNKGKLGIEFGGLLWKHNKKEFISEHFSTNLLYNEGALLFTSIINYYSQTYGNIIRPKIFIGFINLMPIDNIFGLAFDYKYGEFIYVQLCCAVLYRSKFKLSLDSHGITKADMSSLIIISIRY